MKKIRKRNCMMQTNEGCFKAIAIFDGRMNGLHETVLVKSLESDHVFRCYRGVANNKFRYNGENPTFYAC